MGAQHEGFRLLRAEALFHDASPQPARGAELGDLLEEIEVGVEEEAETRRELVDVEARSRAQLHVGEPVAEGEGKLLRGGRTGLSDVVPRHRDRMPARHLGRTERHRVANEPQGRPWREHELLLRLVLLEDVVLERSSQSTPIGARRLSRSDEHREDRCGRRVDRHRGRRAFEIDSGEQVLHVDLGIDRDAAGTHLADAHRVVGVVPHERGQIERR